MAKTFRPWDVEQGILFPPSVNDLVPADHLAHFVRDVVRESLDLGEILADYDEERGYPPFHPALMTALLLYAYCRGVYSSRKIETACEERVDFMAVTGREKPDHTTIAKFRRRHRPALSGLFVQVLRLCRAAGMAKLGHVALDGSKVPANASKHKAMSYGRMVQAEKELRQEVGRWLTAADRTDAEEDAAYGAGKRGDEMPEWARRKVDRLAKIREAKQRLEAEAAARAGEEEKKRDEEPPGGGPSPPASSAGPEEKAQSNFTDPESRILRKGNEYVQGYNGQAAVDAESQVIVACGVVAKQNDGDEMVPLVEQVRAHLGDVPQELSADSSYCSEANLQWLEDNGIRGYVATGRVRHGDGTLTRTIRSERTQALKMRARLRRGGWRSRYRLRKQVVEPVFGQIKEARGFRRFLTRGLEAVRAEWALLCTAHNLLKLAKVAAR